MKFIVCTCLMTRYRNVTDLLLIQLWKNKWHNKYVFSLNCWGDQSLFRQFFFRTNCYQNWDIILYNRYNFQNGFRMRRLLMRANLVLVCLIYNDKNSLTWPLWLFYQWFYYFNYLHLLQGIFNRLLY
jgi:hypothetical protein